MSKLTDRASYLKGLADGMDLNMEKGSNKLLVEALSVMQEMAEELEKLSNSQGWIDVCKPKEPVNAG